MDRLCGLHSPQDSSSRDMRWYGTMTSLGWFCTGYAEGGRDPPKSGGPRASDSVSPRPVARAVQRAFFSPNRKSHISLIIFSEEFISTGIHGHLVIITGQFGHLRCRQLSSERAASMRKRVVNTPLVNHSLLAPPLVLELLSECR